MIFTPEWNHLKFAWNAGPSGSYPDALTTAIALALSSASFRTRFSRLMRMLRSRSDHLRRFQIRLACSRSIHCRANHRLDLEQAEFHWATGRRETAAERWRKTWPDGSSHTVEDHRFELGMADRADRGGPRALHSQHRHALQKIEQNRTA